MRRQTPLWHSVYRDLSDGKPGLLGAVISRAEAQVVRLSMIYALLACSPVVRTEHLLAALAFWDYAEQSARYIFGDRLGDAIADRILEAVREAGAAGVDREYIHRQLFGANVKSARVQAALDALLGSGLIVAKKIQGEQGGRPRTVYAKVG